jgi:hypothetical protein
VITARPFSVTNATLYEGFMRFTLVIHTSLGPLSISGFRLTDSGELRSPSLPIGAGRYVSLVNLTPHQRSLVKKLALRLNAQARRRLAPTPVAAASSESQTPAQS